MMIGAVLLVILGWLCAIPASVWWERDTRPISRRTWYWSGYQRHVWTRGIVIGLVMFGWPAIVIIPAWRFSEQRSELMAESAERRERRNQLVPVASRPKHRRGRHRARA